MSPVLVVNNPPAGVATLLLSLSAPSCWDGSNIPGTGRAPPPPEVPPAPAGPEPPPMYPLRFMSVGSAMGINHTLRPPRYCTPRQRMAFHSRNEGSARVGRARV